MISATHAMSAECSAARTSGFESARSQLEIERELRLHIAQSERSRQRISGRSERSATLGQFGHLKEEIEQLVRKWMGRCRARWRG